LFLDITVDQVTNEFNILTMKKIVIAGANGFLGESLCLFLKERYKIIGLVRKLPIKQIPGVNYRLWDGKTQGDWLDDISGAAAVINLVGRSVDCRYNTKNKNAILQSRVESTDVIGKAIENARIKPDLWINGASATIYRHSEDVLMKEVNGEIGEGFSVDVCKAWETSFNSFNIEETRKVLFRVGIVLGIQGGAFLPLKRLTQMGMGGTMGNGNQFISWISIEDFCKGMLFVIENKQLEGVFNLVSPNPIKNKDFMATLRKVYNPFLGIPTSKLMLEIGARLIQTETELILKSRYVYPQRLLESGYTFSYPNLMDWLNKKRSPN
jgi:uncharacterized protein